MPRTFTGQRDMIVLDAAYHGHTNALIDISPYKFNGPGGAGQPDWVHIAPIPDDYRGAYRRGLARLLDDAPAGLTVTAGTFATTQGGSITIAANGSFSYNPPRGFEGTDTYAYTLNDGNAVAGVTVTVDGMEEARGRGVVLGRPLSELPDPEQVRSLMAEGLGRRRARRPRRAIGPGLRRRCDGARARFA